MKVRKTKKVEKRGAETTKMDHLRMYTFAWRMLGGALECVVFLGEKCLFSM